MILKFIRAVKGALPLHPAQGDNPLGNPYTKHHALHAAWRVAPFWPRTHEEKWQSHFDEKRFERGWGSGGDITCHGENFP